MKTIFEYSQTNEGGELPETELNLILLTLKISTIK